MNILILYASPKRTGCTQKLTDAFLSGLDKQNTVKYVRLFELNPIPCNDCGYCRSMDGCSKKDLDVFTALYRAADVIVISTPVYLFSMPAPLKALFDRFQRFYNARFVRGIAQPIEKPKQAVLLLTAGTDGKIGQRIIEEQVRTAFSVMHTSLTASVLLADTDRKPDIQPALQKARLAGRTIQKNWEENSDDRNQL